MIYYDGIISQLQRNGGVTIYFAEILSRLMRDEISFFYEAYGESELTKLLSNHQNEHLSSRLTPRLFERYRASRVSKDAKLFHSTYYRLPSMRSMPIVTTVHDFTYERKVGGLRTAVHSAQKRAAILASDAVICVSESTKSDLLDVIGNCDPSKVQVIYNGVSDDYLPLPSVRQAAQSERPFVLFVGSRCGYKNFDIAAKVVSDLSDHALVAVGGGDLSNSERSLVSTLLPGRFRHVGFVSTDALNRLYNQASFLLYPSSYEGFGIPIAEAMKVGCPIVAVRSSSIPEVAGPAGFLAEEATRESLSDTIIMLHDTKEKQKRISLGIDWARKFSWESTYAATNRVYSSLCSGLTTN
ncbi:glycosyltransferase family 1 protein [Loktanella sp. 5RATIMAR09]|uniref:glycosyltransferase family 4 protein n=1 Tax=Loktanella sp. 5RATIMAR09 TaxID=1225655 RepID=UPI0009FB450B|nr:glycosyltransferase family 1 protein [Loktanella sp. 5RATIMAR09]